MPPFKYFFSNFSAQSLIYTASVPVGQGEILSLKAMLVGLSRSVVSGQRRHLALNVIPVIWSCPRRSLTWLVFWGARAHPDSCLTLFFVPWALALCFYLSSCLMLFCLIGFASSGFAKSLIGCIHLIWVDERSVVAWLDAKWRVEL